MEAAMVPQVQKREFKNNTNGWLGVVVLDPKGEEKGVSVEPHSTVWLSEAEVILTARAPRDPKDNPFEEQTFVGVDDGGTRQEFQMRPLVPADTDPRYVPTQERYVPPPAATDAATGGAEAAARNQVETSPQAAAREEAIKAAPPAQGDVQGAQPAQVAGPPSTGSQALTPDEEAEERPSWTEAPPAPGEVIPGALSGADGPSPSEEAAAAPDPTAAPPAPTAPPQSPVPPAAPTAPEMTAEELAGDIRQPSEEEHAAAVDPGIGEETGAAQPPSGEPPEGEFAQAEEVGTPDAPSHSERTEDG